MIWKGAIGHRPMTNLLDLGVFANDLDQAVRLTNFFNKILIEFQRSPLEGADTTTPRILT